MRPSVRQREKHNVSPTQPLRFVVLHSSFHGVLVTKVVDNGYFLIKTIALHFVPEFAKETLFVRNIAKLYVPVPIKLREILYMQQHRGGLTR